MGANFPEVGCTLRRGASEAELNQAEKALGVKFPIPTRVLYRLCDGQDTVAQNTVDHERLAPLGIIGGYEFYDFAVNVHLLPLSQIVVDTKVLPRQLCRSKHITVAASFYFEKWFCLNCSNGQLYVGTKNLVPDGEIMPCVPEALLRPSLGGSDDVDALLLWLEEHCRRLHSGMIRTRKIRKCRSISLYPEAPPSCSVAVTNGVQVRASAVFVPELSELHGGEDKYLFSYSIRMSLLPDGCMLDGMYHSSCQLRARHWIIKSRDEVVSNVNGEAVIGKYPLLFPGKEEFVYESCTPLSAAPGSVEGSFTFVPGRMRKPGGREFEVEVAPIVLMVPDYIF